MAAWGFEPVIISCPTDEVVLAGNPVIVKFLMNEIFRYQIAPALVRIRLLTADGWVEHIENVAYGSDMIGVIDISEVFDKQITPEIFFNGAPNNVSTKSFITFEIEVGVDISQSDVTADDLTVVYGEKHYGTAVPGGFSSLFLDYLNTTPNFNDLYCAGFIPYTNGAVNKFLTCQPNNRKVSPTMSNRLYFWAINIPEAVWKIEGVVTFADAETQAYAVTINAIGPAINSILCGLHELVPVLDADHGDVLTYTVKITHNGADYTETRTFKVDYTYYENQTLIFVQNSRGTYDALWFTGAVKRMGAYTFENLERVGTYINGGNYGAGRTTSINKFVVNTGHKSKAEKRAMQDALHNRGFIMPVGNILIPGFINNEELTWIDSQNEVDAASADIELVLGYKERWWDDFDFIENTAVLGGAFSDGFNNGFFI